MFGLMPHPEHAVDPLLGSTDGALDARLAASTLPASGCSRRPEPERLRQGRPFRQAVAEPFEVARRAA